MKITIAAKSYLSGWAFLHEKEKSNSMKVTHHTIDVL